MTKDKNRLSRGRPILFVVLVLIVLVLVIRLLLSGNNAALFNPRGLIAQQQFNLLMLSVTILFALAIPTLIVFYLFAWNYRESNTKARRDNHTHYGKLFNFFIWTIPSTFILILAFNMWPATHNLAPQKAVASSAKPLTIQVVALRWKWLFIYPEQHIATVNAIEVPVDTPLQFDLTADEIPMSSFWVPQLGGQLYAMTGHENRLNLMATAPGNYNGGAAEINGAGFSGMKFVVGAGSTEDFNQWVHHVKQYPKSLNNDEYSRLLIPSQNNPAAAYSDVSPSLYNNIVMKYNQMDSNQMHMGY